MNANQQLAGIFSQMADVMQILGHDGFRINAFQRAARTLDDLSEDVAAIGPAPAKLATIPGIGQGLAQRIAEFLTTGKIKDHQDLLAQIPPGLIELLNIPGLGPKTIALFWKQGGITGVADLKKKLATAELAQLPGMGEKKLANLRQSLAFTQSAKQRFLLGRALPLASGLIGQLSQMPDVQQVDYAGSLRRGKETIGDLDILVSAAASAAAISQRFVELQPAAEVLAHGATKTSVRTTEGFQVDLRIVAPESFGAALLYFTGSKEHNVLLRQRAIERGLKLNEYGLFHGAKNIASATEEEVYRALGLAWIPPELREARNEITLAENNQLPALLAVSDIKAELHAHTTASDGHWSIRELVGAAIDRGFHTVAVTDHSVSQVIANGLTAERLEQHIYDVRAVAQQVENKIRVLAGSEVDILADGRLDYPNSLLRELDVVVASPHAALSQDPRKATARLLKAIENPYVTILGHPTGRLLGKRPGLAPDMKELIAAAARRGIALEINANSYRLDLRDAHARAALEAGVKLAINTDAHSPPDLDQLRYGVLTARRAGASAHDVVNCLPADQLAKWLTSTRP